MYKITKEFAFCASHQLTGLPESHPCTRLHGHNYLVKVELKSKTLNETGFVKDYRDVSSIKKWIDEMLDHSHLNEIFNFNPTAENIAEFLFRMWKKTYPELSAVEVSETPKTNARYEPDNNF